MPRTTSFVCALALSLLGGCASAPSFTSPPEKVLQKPAEGMAATVIVIRESAQSARFVGLTVGVNGQAFANLDNAQRLSVSLPAGEPHTVFVQARGAKPAPLALTLAAGAVVCLRATADPATFLKALVPGVLMATGYAFFLDRVPCPPESVLASYPEVPVVYR